VLPEDSGAAPRSASIISSPPHQHHHNATPAAVPVAVVVRVHPAAEREPLPLALHHTPINATLAVFKVICICIELLHHLCLHRDLFVVLSIHQPRSSSSGGDGAVMLPDPLRQEEQAQDGSITYTYNAHG
jgi:exosome complex RNA-binding protein Rrp42 (RNase PH superfamily)